MGSPSPELLALCHSSSSPLPGARGGRGLVFALQESPGRYPLAEARLTRLKLAPSLAVASPDYVP